MINIKKAICLIMLVGLIFIIGCEKEQPAEPETYPNWQDYWTLLYESQGLYQITFVNNEEAWITGGETHKMIHYQNGTFTEIVLPEPVEEPYQWWIERCSFYDPEHGFAVGNGNQLALSFLYKYENGVWSQMPPIELQPIVMTNYYDVKAFAADDIWVCGCSMSTGACAWHWDGTNWIKYALLDSYAYHLYFASPNDGYVTTASWLWHWDGTKWHCEAQFPDHTSDACSDNSGNNFVAMRDSSFGLYGIYMEYPVIWRHVDSSYCACFLAMAGNSQGEIWAGGDSILLPSYNVLANWTGQHWIYYKTQPCIPYTLSLFVKENGEVWAVIGDYHTCYVAKLNKENLPTGGN